MKAEETKLDHSISGIVRQKEVQIEGGLSHASHARRKGT